MSCIEEYIASLRGGTTKQSMHMKLKQDDFTVHRLLRSSQRREDYIYAQQRIKPYKSATQVKLHT